MTSALLRLTSRPTYWRIAVILPGHILWRTYSRVEYPTPDDAVRRCLAGLVQPPKHAKQHEQSPTPCQRFAFDFGEYPPESERACHREPKPEHRLPAIDGDKAMQHGLNPQIFDYQPCRPPEEHATQVCQQNHVRALSLLHRGSNYGQYESEGRKGEDREKIIHPRPLLPVRVRAAWWGWL